MTVRRVQRRNVWNKALVYGATAPHPQRARVFSSSMLHDHTLRHTTLRRTPLDEWSARRRDLYLTKRHARNRQTSMASGGIRTRNTSKRAAADRYDCKSQWEITILKTAVFTEIRTAHNPNAVLREDNCTNLLAISVKCSRLEPEKLIFWFLIRLYGAVHKQAVKLRCIWWKSFCSVRDSEPWYHALFCSTVNSITVQMMHTWKFTVNYNSTFWWLIVCDVSGEREVRHLIFVLKYQECSLVGR